MTSKHDIDVACGAILENLEKAGSQANIVIGFDTEWDFNVSPDLLLQRPTSLVQMATQKAVYLMHVHELGNLPPSLLAVLTNQRIVKVGRNVGGDIARLSVSWPELASITRKHGNNNGVVELGVLARQKHVVANVAASLAEMVAATHGRYLNKTT
jgi:hypothetical protein